MRRCRILLLRCVFVEILCMSQQVLSIARDSCYVPDDLIASRLDYVGLVLLWNHILVLYQRDRAIQPIIIVLSESWFALLPQRKPSMLFSDAMDAEEYPVESLLDESFVVGRDTELCHVLVTLWSMEIAVDAKFHMRVVRSLVAKSEVRPQRRYDHG